MKCRFAELNIEILNRERYVAGLARNYLAEFDTADITLSVSDEDIAREKKKSQYDMSTGMAEAIALYRKLGCTLPDFDGFVLHSATFEIQGRGIGFLAKSGTGKSTHMLNWKKLFGDGLTVINGDKPIVRIKDGVPFAYGTPWCGKEGLSKNDSVPLTDLCFIVRSDINEVIRLDRREILNRLFAQVVVPAGSENILKTLALIDKTVQNCNIWEIRCNPDVSSAQKAANIILEVEK